MRVRRGAAVALSSILTILSASSAAYADSDVAGTLTLDPAYVGPVGRTAAEQPAELNHCAEFPAGIETGFAGWRFGQPARDASVLAYSLGFIGTVKGKPGAILIGVTDAGIWRIETDGGQHEAVPVPEGVDGGLLDGGADGAWLRTPADWRLAPGALRVTGATGEVPKTFALSAVCSRPSAPPASDVPDDEDRPDVEHPAGGAVPSGSPGTRAPVVTEVAAGSGAAGGLPVTGGPVLTIAVAGLVTSVLGVLLFLLARRRTRT